MRKLKGIVVSHKMSKTVVVRVDRLKKNEKYQKFHRLSRTYKAHDEKGEYRAGDAVWIEETRPLSKEKRWNVIQLVKRSAAIETEDKAANRT